MLLCSALVQNTVLTHFNNPQCTDSRHAVPHLIPNFDHPQIPSSLCHLEPCRHASVIALKVSACSHCHYLSLSLPPSFSRSSTTSLSCISFLSSGRQIKVPSLVVLWRLQGDGGDLTPELNERQGNIKWNRRWLNVLV